MNDHVDEEFEEYLSSYEAATVELVNTAPPGSSVAHHAIENLRECLQLRIQVEMERSGRRSSKGRRLTDYYPSLIMERHFCGPDRRRLADRRAVESQ